ncbi:MAG: M48 family metalloprotease [Betaproteobacteria bacterium]|nr:M48 family metalloprotease [Betaproteobacteria bacterium]
MTISRGGGRFIAEQLGGRRIMRNTSDPTERRLLNVIDEMSIAAGIPAPVAFVLDNEHGLNAFAAGLTTRDSVIGVTHGLLKAMTRDELQGVIAHEISHIANGDARLNLKLISYLYGISGIGSCGRGLIFAGSLAIIHGVVLITLGLFLYLVGFIGLFFVRLIQATISREREYLADAAAVQFTRYPAGLASALRKLQASGSQIEHPEAMVASHLFFGVSDTSVMDFLFATHPPLTGRILRLGGLMKPQPGLPKKISPKSLKDARTLLMPKTLRQKSHSITGATGILAGLLFARQSNIRAQQEKMLPLDALPVAQEVYQWLAKRSEHGARYRLVWLDLILPTLQEALEAERDHLLVLAKDLIRADGRVSPTEFAFYSILRSVLLSPHERRVKQSELRLGRLDKDISDILALLAYSGHEDVKAAEAAYQAAIASSPASTKHPLPAKNELSLNKISEALSHLALAAPPYRKKLLEACAVAVQHDGKITPVENELLRAFAQSLDCPAPLLDAWQQAA